jgi:hypothetical protein
MRERRENKTGAKNRHGTRPKDRDRTGAENGSDRNQPESPTSNEKIYRKQRGEGVERQEREQDLGEKEDDGSGEHRGVRKWRMKREREGGTRGGARRRKEVHWRAARQTRSRHLPI